MKENNIDTMIVLAKPNNNGFIVNENNIDTFLNHKKGSNNKLDTILEKAKRIENNIVHRD